MTESITKGVELARLLGVSAAAISKATKSGHRCQGWPVAEWAERSHSGRVLGYAVDNEVLARLKLKAAELRAKHETFPAKPPFRMPAGVPPLSLLAPKAEENASANTRQPEDPGAARRARDEENARILAGLIITYAPIALRFLQEKLFAPLSKSLNQPSETPS